MKQIRIGCIGIGVISRCVHIPGIMNSPDLKLVAVCDNDPQALKWAKENYGIDEKYCFSDYRDLIACPDVDAVDISTPNDSHFEIALEAAKAKKPYALEKPVTLCKEEADELAAVTKENGVANMICFSYRFKAAARYARDLIKKGVIGEVYHVDMQYYQAWALPFYETPLKWRFVKKRTGSGALGDLGSHALDLVRFVTGQEYTKLVSHTGTFINERKKEDGSGMGAVDVDDFSNYLAEMNGGAVATFRITRYGFGRGNYQTMEIYGSKGAIQYELDHSAPDTDEISVCIGDFNGDKHIFSKLVIPDEYKCSQMQAFADIINGKADGLSADIFDGQKNQHAVDAVISSSKNGQWELLNI